MTTPPINIPALLDATADLEVGHPIEAVLASFEMADGCTAYEVVSKYQRSLSYAATGMSNRTRSFWARMVDRRRPCVAAIAEWFATEIK